MATTPLEDEGTGEDDLLISPVEEIMVTPPPPADRAATSQGADRRSATATIMAAGVTLRSIDFMVKYMR